MRGERGRTVRKAYKATLLLKEILLDSHRTYLRFQGRSGNAEVSRSAVRPIHSAMRRSQRSFNCCPAIRSVSIYNRQTAGRRFVNQHAGIKPQDLTGSQDHAAFKSDRLAGFKCSEFNLILCRKYNPAAVSRTLRPASAICL